MPSDSTRIRTSQADKSTSGQTVTQSLLTAAAFVVACTTLVMVASPGLDGPLMFDSVKLQSLEQLVDTYGRFAILHTPGFDGDLNRIVSMATFVADTQLAEGISPARFRSTNMMIHLLNAALVFFLIRTLLRATDCARVAAVAAIATSIIWLLSPANVNVMLYAIQRMTMLSALFTLAGLLCYLHGRLQERATLRWLLLATAALICLPLAVLSKPNGALLLPLAWLLEVWVLHARRPWFSGAQLSAVAVAGMLAALLLAPVLVPGIFNYEHRDFTLLERVLSQPRALASYVWHLLAPLGADAGLYTDGFSVSRGLTTPIGTLLALLTWVAAAIGIVLERGGRFSLIAFGVAFFLVGHAIESTVIPLELYFLHRNYLPSIGLYFALVAALLLWLRAPRRVLIAVTVYCMAFAWVSGTRASTWSSRESMATAAVIHNPDSSRAWANFSQLATDAQQYELALQAVDRSIALSDAPNGRIQRLFVLCRGGLDATAADYRTLASSDTLGVEIEVSQALNNLLRLYASGNCPQLQVEQLVDALDALAARYRDRNRDTWVVDYYTVSFLQASGDAPHAHARLQRQIADGHLESGLLRLEWLVDDGRYTEAGQQLREIRLSFSAAERRVYQPTLDAIGQQILEARSDTVSQ